MSKLKEILTQSMAKAGQVVEKIAQVAQKAKKKKPAQPKKTGVVDESGEDFAAIQWDERHIHSLLSGAERTEMFPLIPALAGKKTLHLTPAGAEYIHLLTKRGGQDFVELDVTRSSVTSEPPQPRDYPFARGAVEKLPFKDKCFDFILYPSALAWRSDLPNLIPEMVRCLKDNGRFVISTVHPFFEYLMNPRGGFKKNVGKLYQQLKQEGFFIDELREATLDETLRHVSLPSHLNKELRRFQGMPIVLLLRGIIVRKRKAA